MTHIKRRKAAGRTFSAYLFLLPALVLIGIFLVYPILDSIRLSFFKYTLKANEFTGLSNYQTLLTDTAFQKALLNTFKYAVIIVPVTVLCSMAAAAMIYKKRSGTTALYRGIFYLPTISSAVTVSVIWNWIFNPVFGIANYLLSLFGVDTLTWLSDRTLAFYCVCLVSILCSIGQPVILYTAALGGVSRDYYEAAALDGASELTQFWKITVPMLKPTTLYVLVITSINAFQIFVPIQLLTEGGPVSTTTSIMYYLYNTAFTGKNFGYASAMGMVLFLILGVLAILQFRLMREKE